MLKFLLASTACAFFHTRSGGEDNVSINHSSPRPNLSKNLSSAPNLTSALSMLRTSFTLGRKIILGGYGLSTANSSFDIFMSGSGYTVE